MVSKEDTMRFLNQAYETVLDRLVQESELDKILGKEDEEYLLRTCYKGAVATSVTDTVLMLVRSKDQYFSEENLDGMLYDSERVAEYAVRAGLTESDAKLVIDATKKAFLEDLFSDQVELAIDDKAYVMGRHDRDLYVLYGLPTPPIPERR